jgi:hypothetical protein
MKRDTASTIFRTVVFAGAMLGAPACSKKQPQTTPTNTATQPTGGDPAMMQGGDAAAKKPDADPCAADPCAGDPCGGDPCGGGERPRGSDDDGGGGTGRGFILS